MSEPSAAASLGLEVGAVLLPPWRVVAVEPGPRRVRVRVGDGADGRVTFAISPGDDGGRPGPLDVGGVRVAYEATDVPWKALAPVGRALGTRLLEAAGPELGDAVRAALAAPPPPAGDDVVVDAARLADGAPLLGARAPASVRQLVLLAHEGPPPATWARDAAAAVAAGVRDVVVHLPAARPVATGEAAVAAAAGSALAVVLHLPAGSLSSAADARAGVEGGGLAPLGAAGVGVQLAVEVDRGALAALDALVDAVAAARPGERFVLALGPLRFRGRAADYADAAPALPDEAAAVTAALRRARAAGLHATVAPGPGLPLCLLDEDVRPAPDVRSRVRPVPGHVAGAFPAPCDRCGLRRACPGPTEAYVRAFGDGELRPAPPAARAPDAGPWQDEVRRLLVGRPDATVRLADVVPPDALPFRACILPWTNLETDPSANVGPCCTDYQASRTVLAPGEDPYGAWNGPSLRAFRRALAGGGPPATCRDTCPNLLGGIKRLDRLVLRGGGAEAVEHQITAVEDIVAGREEARSGPLDLTFPATSYCNYDCLMCSYGEEGTLDDEPAPAFFEGLAARLPGLLGLTVLGGEPFASPRFREFLERTDFSVAPQLRIALITNGSYLTPGQLDRFAHVPFQDFFVSLNAATPETYLAVNRGLTWERIRRNLDALLARRRDGRLRASLTYSMVLLKANLHEVRAFAELAWGDGVDVRFRLPAYNRNDQSIMRDRALMAQAHEALADVAERAWQRGSGQEARDVLAQATVLADRLERGVLELLGGAPQDTERPRAPRSPWRDG